jgi:hypothetical protein
MTICTAVIEITILFFIWLIKYAAHTLGLGESTPYLILDSISLIGAIIIFLLYVIMSIKIAYNLLSGKLFIPSVFIYNQEKMKQILNKNDINDKKEGEK